MPHWMGERSPAWGRDVRADGLEQLTDEAVGRVGDESDPATGPGDPGDLIGGPLLIRREHAAEDGADHVEAAVVERQRLGVALHEVRVQALRIGAPSRALEQGGHVVEPDDGAPASSRGEGGIPAARRDVEHTLGGVDVERLDQELRDDDDLRPDHVVVATRPGRLLALLDRAEVRRGRSGDRGWHGVRGRLDRRPVRCWSSRAPCCASVGMD